jgi:transposase
MDQSNIFHQLEIFRMVYGMRIKLLLPSEKPNKTIGRPVIPFGKVLDGILYILRTGCQWKMLPKEYGSGSTCHRRFREWTVSKAFQRLWVRLDFWKPMMTLEALDGIGNRLTAYL